MKSTEKLINEIKTAYNITQFISDNEGDIYDPQLCGYIREIMKEKKLNRAQIMRDGLLNQNYAYQILSGKKNPSRDKVIQLCFGMRLNLDEAQRLMKLADVGALYPRNKRDAVVMYGLENKMTLMRVNFILDEINEYPFE